MGQTADPSKTSPLVLTNPKGLFDPAPYGFSHVAQVAPGTRLIYLAGQGGESETGALQPDFRLQVRQAFQNIRTALESVGAGVGDVAKLTMLVVDHTEEKLRIIGPELDAAWNGGMKPTCTLIPVPRLALDGMLFEVEAVAVLRA
ncbi:MULTISPECIES: RidA family protein [Myxococcus]|uniref:Enamine deaminase RidA n=1 Tax=Myxococcus virescens TaxID=83456 RepID=A0A511HGB9_9BACT|nr:MULTISPECIES: RidA family protein [Myxococcus]QQR46078.1 RidA family protein [Myxococcus xanthus]WNZ63926.1 RidA family protein [Myxococcus sp. MxC21-1]GEL72414.1 enamine deaminase RidA [Myxococcus virescens]SDF06768.1 Enamine deaminase RidA, house cleaning of reactive enamine intermediates, YjgF/YER057c/UK114 family [Myxococcus virescens]